MSAHVTPRPWAASERSVGTIIAAELAEGEVDDKSGRAEPETIAYYGGIIVCESMRTADRDYALRAVNQHDRLTEIEAATWLPPIEGSGAQCIFCGSGIDSFRPESLDRAKQMHRQECPAVSS